MKNGVPGQKVRFSVNKIRQGKAEGKILEVLERGQAEIPLHVLILGNAGDVHTRIFHIKSRLN